jgi:hypothetical protein
MASPGSILGADTGIVSVTPQITRILYKPEELSQRGGPEIVFVPGDHRTGTVAGPAHDAVDILENPVYLPVVDPVSVFGKIAVRKHIRLNFVQGFPEGIHVDNQIFLDLHVCQRLYDDLSGFEGLEFRAAGKIKIPVDYHRTRSADSLPAAVAKRQRAVLFITDGHQGFEDRFALCCLEEKALETGKLILFRIEP